MPFVAPPARAPRPSPRKILAAIALLAMSAAAWAEGAAGTPYAVLYQALAAARDVDGDPRLRAVQRIESKLPGVRSDQIEVVIRSRSGRMVVPIGADGSAALPAAR